MSAQTHKNEKTLVYKTVIKSRYLKSVVCINVRVCTPNSNNVVIEKKGIVGLHQFSEKG